MALLYGIIVDIHSVLWHCRLGVGNGIWYVKKILLWRLGLMWSNFLENRSSAG